jgi:hypothetical protein
LVLQERQCECDRRFVRAWQALRMPSIHDLKRAHSLWWERLEGLVITAGGRDFLDGRGVGPERPGTRWGNPSTRSVRRHPSPSTLDWSPQSRHQRAQQAPSGQHLGSNTPESGSDASLGALFVISGLLGTGRTTQHACSVMKTKFERISWLGTGGPSTRTSARALCLRYRWM